jgi:hypothetical protein
MSLHMNFCLSSIWLWQLFAMIYESLIASLVTHILFRYLTLIEIFHFGSNTCLAWNIKEIV